MKKISIIIPIYNTDVYLKKCLDSILCECDNQAEIILVNDGSTDDSKKICEGYLKTYPNVVLFNNENHGVSYSRNFGLKKAKGEWILFVDSDDMLKKGWYASLLENVDSKYDFVFYSSHVNGSKQFTKDEMLEFITGYNKNSFGFSSPSSKLYRRQFLKKFNILFKENIINGEDMLFNVECLKYSKNFTICGKSFYSYLINANSSTKNYNYKIFSSDLNFQIQLKEILDNSDFDIKLRENILAFCKKNAVFILAQRLAFSGKYNIFKKNIKKLKNYFNTDFLKINLGLKKEIILGLLFVRLNFFVFLIFNFQRKKIKSCSYYIDI